MFHKETAKMMGPLLTMVKVFVVCYVSFNVETLINLYPAFTNW